MAINLNKQNRGDIINAIIKSTFDKREQELKSKHTELAQLAYEAAMPEGFIQKTKSLPDGWLCQCSMVNIKIDGCTYTMPLSAKLRDDGTYQTISELNLPGVRKFPANMGRHYSAPYLNLSTSGTGAEVAAMVIAQLDAERALVREKKGLHAQLSGILHSLKTVEKFVEVAPELAQFIPEHIRNATQRSGLPTVQVGSLITSLMQAGLSIPEPAPAA